MKPISMDDHDWPVLNRAAFLIEHACVPKSYPSFCAETAQILAALVERMRQGSPQENDITLP